ncbi:MAG: hypothetical protein WC438_06210 [Candidatus Pacearchaeota archaeon]
MNKKEEWLNDYKNFDLLIELVNEKLCDVSVDLCPISKDLLDELVFSTKIKSKNETLERIKSAFKELEDDGFTSISIEQLLKIINKSITNI